MLGDVCSTRADEHGRERRAHPCLLALPVLPDHLVGAADGLRQGRVTRRLERSIGDLPRDRLDDQCARHLPGLGASHPVRDGQEDAAFSDVEAGVRALLQEGAAGQVRHDERVFVVLAYESDVGHRGDAHIVAH